MPTALKRTDHKITMAWQAVDLIFLDNAMNWYGLGGDSLTTVYNNLGKYGVSEKVLEVSGLFGSPAKKVLQCKSSTAIFAF